MILFKTQPTHHHIVQHIFLNKKLAASVPDGYQLVLTASDGPIEIFTSHRKKYNPKGRSSSPHKEIVNIKPGESQYFYIDAIADRYWLMKATETEYTTHTLESSKTEKPTLEWHEPIIAPFIFAGFPILYEAAVVHSIIVNKPFNP